MNKTHRAPALQEILSSLLWLTAHPRRHACLHYQSVVQRQLRYLAELPESEIGPSLRLVAERLSDEIESTVNEELVTLRHRAGVTIN